MAKRRKEKDEEEEEKVDFKLPKFDEKEFIRKEKEKIKTTFISFVFGFIIALISFGFWVLLSGNPVQWTLVMLFGIFSTAWLNYLFKKFNFDLVQLGKKGLFSSYAIYILTWVFVLIVLVNPPFYDDESPVIDAVSLPGMQEPGGTVKIVAHIVDNTGIKDDTVDFILKHNGSTLLSNSYTIDNGIFLYEYTNPDGLLGSFSYELETTDTSGYTTSYNGTFEYSTDVIRVPEPTGSEAPPGPTLRYTTDIKIDIKPDVDWVYYTIETADTTDVHTVNATKGDTDYYTSTAKMDGWTRNSEATIQVYAKVYHYFENVPTGYNNTIVDTDVHYYNVSDDAEIGTETIPKVSLPQPRYVYVPGFETVLFVISLVGVVLVIKYSKKHKKQ